MNKSELVYSEYQKNIFDWVRNGTGHGAAIAVAGSSKTTTAVKSMDEINPMLAVRFNCFGKAIQTELSEKIKHLHNAEASTYNALGWGICRKRWGYIKLTKDKTDQIFKYKVMNLANNGSEEDKKTYYKLRYMMSKVVGLCKGFACLSTTSAMQKLEWLIDHYALDIKDIDQFKVLFASVYEHVINEVKMMDFDDQLFMPIRYGLAIPKTDVLIVDEWQDTNLIQYEIVKRSIGTQGRILAIGDPDQSIYGFRGTAPDIVDIFIDDFGATRLPLYICYRCPVAAVRNAQQFVPHIEPWSSAKPGLVATISYDEYRKLVSEDDMILCRCTAPLIKSCLKFLAEGRAAYVKGREVAENLTNLVERASKYVLNLDSAKFLDMFHQYVTETKEEYERFNRETAIQLLEDQVESIDAMIVGTKTVQDLIDKINSLFSEGDRKGLCHMTIHKSKGLETTATGSVFSLPYKVRKQKRDWQIQEEERLCYVEATRTRNNHFYVSDSKEK